MAKQPVKEVEGVISEQLKNLDSNIKKQIFGQDGAVEKIVDAIVLNKVVSALLRSLSVLTCSSVLLVLVKLNWLNNLPKK